jgi:hypothetical protein
MKSRIDKMSTSNSPAAYMRGYRLRKRLEGDNCTNVTKRTKLNAERQRDYRKRKAQEEVQENKTLQASTSAEPTPTPIIYNYNQANEYFQKNFIGNSFVYACDICDRLWYMNDLKQVKEKHISVLALEFPGFCT